MTKTLLIRAFTILIGLVTNVLTAHILMVESGYKIYALYVLVTSFPNLFPFADFGLGSNIFNFYADKFNSKFRREKEAKLVSQIFFTIAAGQLLLIFFSFILLHFLNQNNFAKDYWSGNPLLYIFLSLLLTFVAVPFSIGSRKLQAERKFAVVLVVQGLIPVLVFMAIGIGFNVTGTFQPWMLLVPSSAYLVTTILIFLLSGLSEFVRIKFLESDYHPNIPQVRLGIWSLIVTTLFAIVWQIPKYYFGILNNPQAVSRYGLLLMILLPQLSFLNVIASWLAPRARAARNQKELSHLIYPTLRNALVVAICLAIVSIPGFMLIQNMGITTPDSQSIVVGFVILITAPFWVVSFGAVSEVADFKWIAVKLIPLNFVLLSLAIAFAQGEYLRFLCLYFGPITIANSSIMLLRLKIAKNVLGPEGNRNG